MLEKQISQIKEKTDIVPEIAIILGSGLGAICEKIKDAVEIGYDEIEGMPISTAPAHEGKFVIGRLSGKNVIVMSGRVHLYEGYSSKQVAFPVLLMRALGAKYLIVTNASGGINKHLASGDFMLINDHISLFVKSPLIGKNYDKIGPRFPDMSHAYDRELSRLVKSAALENDIKIKEGVYCQLTGPQFETPAEISALSALGADAVGMSTVVEVIAAVHCGFRVCGISVIVNLACGILDKPLTHDEVTEKAGEASEKFIKLITETVRKIDG